MTKCISMLVSCNILKRSISILSILVIFIVLSLLSNLYILSEELAKHQHNIRHYNHHTHHNHRHRNVDYFELDEKISNNQNLYDYNEPNADQKSALVSCPSCFLRLEQLKFLDSDNIRLEAIKQQILLKLGLKAKPNVTHNLSKKVIMDTLSRYENDIFLSRQHLSSSSSSSVVFETKNTSSRSGHRSDRNKDSFGDRTNTKTNDQDDTNHFEPSKIIAFAEKGGSMNGNKILEFSISNGQGSKVMSAHLWLKIEKIASENMNGDETNSDTRTDESGNDDDSSAGDDMGRVRGRNRARIAARKRNRSQRHSNPNRMAENDEKNDQKSSSSRSSFCKPKMWVFKVSENAETETFMDHQRVSSKTFERVTELVASRPIDLDLISDTNWYKFNVTEALRDFAKLSQPITMPTPSSPAHQLRHNEYHTATTTASVLGTEHSKLRLLVDCSGCCHQIFVHRFQDTESPSSPSPETTVNNKNRPYIVIETKSTTTSRKRRRAIDCNSANKGQCCKQRFYVNFKQLGWDDWVIAPAGYFANYCRGDCDDHHRTPDMFRNYYTHVIEEIRKKHELSGMQPCCAPLRFSSMSLIYFGPDNNIIKRDLPKMIVEECGCP